MVFEKVENFAKSDGMSSLFDCLLVILFSSRLVLFGMEMENGLDRKWEGRSKGTKYGVRSKKTVKYARSL